MNYLWGAVNAISAPYQYYRDLNPSTLTGAIDVIVVARPRTDGQGTELACTPFHVRFGKWQVLRPAEKKVKVSVNGKPIPFNMKIGEAGEAFFVFETEGDVPANLITSPILSPASSPPVPALDLAVDAETGRFGARKDVLDNEPDFLDLNAQADGVQDAANPGMMPGVDDADGQVKDGATMGEDAHARYGALVSEEETKARLEDDVRALREVDNPTQVLDNGDIMIDMGGYHSQQPSNQSHYHSQQASNQSQYHDAPSTPPPTLESSVDLPPLDMNTDLIPPSTPSLAEGPVPFPSMRAGSAPPPDNLDVDTPKRRPVSTGDAYSWEWGAFPQRSPVKTKFPRKAALAAAASIAVIGDTSADADDNDNDGAIGAAEFQRSKSLPPDFEENEALSEPEPDLDLDSNIVAAPESLSEDVEAGSPDGDEQEPRAATGWTRWWRRGGGSSSKGRTQSVLVRPSEADDALVGRARVTSGGGERPVLKEVMTPVVATEPTAVADMVVPSPPSEESSPMTPEEHEKRYAKTLRLTSEQLESLDLKPGPNTLTFSLSATGTVACTAKIFLWDHTDHIVVSDIDGTITKSDALGHVFTMIGRDWTHLGVAKLYTDIARNGYKMMYLTSRAIGQADTTRWYLQSIKQNDHQLPEGPVIMSPDRLLASLHREVIMRKPEVFKMACLRDIQRLFGPTAPHPFYAGFGNRITDALSYRSVNIPSSRIFTIDSGGEVRMELLALAGYRSPSVASYIHMADLVDQMFPPVERKYEHAYTDGAYWTAPIPDVPLPDLTTLSIPPLPPLSSSAPSPSPPSPTLSARSDTSTTSALAKRLRSFGLGGSGNTAATANLNANANASGSGGSAGEDSEGRRGRAEGRATPSGTLARLSGALVSFSRSVSPLGAQMSSSTSVSVAASPPSRMSVIDFARSGAYEGGSGDASEGVLGVDERGGGGGGSDWEGWRKEGDEEDEDEAYVRYGSQASSYGRRQSHHLHHHYRRPRRRTRSADSVVLSGIGYGSGYDDEENEFSFGYGYGYDEVNGGDASPTTESGRGGDRSRDGGVFGEMDGLEGGDGREEGDEAGVDDEPGEEEPGEQTFDDDLFAAGEMQKVPYL